MSNISPFSYVQGANEKHYNEDLSGYSPYLTNRAFAYHMDTILLAEEMNQCHAFSPTLQYDFYYHSVRKGKRFGFPPKIEDDHNLHHVMKYFQCSKQKALEYLQVLTLNDISGIISSLDVGGQ